MKSGYPRGSRWMLADILLRLGRHVRPYRHRADVKYWRREAARQVRGLRTDTYWTHAKLQSLCGAMGEFIDHRHK